MAKLMEEIGRGVPRIVQTPKGARQFIFPNDTVIRFDLKPGQYMERLGQVPHVNIEKVPGAKNLISMLI